MSVLVKIRIGENILRFRKGNYACRKVIPFIERGPFGCFLISWEWGQIGWELARWTE